MQQHDSPTRDLPTKPAIHAAITAKELPGESSMWVMVLGDLLIFAGYFVVFMVYRTMNPEAFLAAQQHLDIDIGVINTVVLLTSSLFVARAVLAARAGKHNLAIALVCASGAAGIVFLILKGYEWAAKVSAGHTNSDTFFQFYYVITGVHLSHVVLGLIVLGVLVRELRAPGRRRSRIVESGALYWHMVDLLWVVIFGLLYVMR